MFRLTIDNRENKIIENCNQLEILHTVQSLDVGDLRIDGPSGQVFLFERKSLCDLALSLRDGRFKDQKDRLLGVLQREPLTSVAYIIEGTFHYSQPKKIVNGRITLQTIYSLLNTTQLKYRIPIITTKDVMDTTMYIKSFLDQLSKNDDFMPVSSGSNAGCFEHTSLMPKISNNRKTDPQSILTSMLTAIPGISFKTACGIIEHFQTSFYGFINYIRTHCLQDFNNELQNVKINHRKLSKKIRELIMNTFYSDILDSTNIREAINSSPINDIAPPLFLKSRTTTETNDEENNNDNLLEHNTDTTETTTNTTYQDINYII